MHNKLLHYYLPIGSMVLSLFISIAVSTHADATVLFQDNFNQDGSSFVNLWDTFVLGAPYRAATEGDFVAGREGTKGLIFVGHANQTPQDTIERHIATRGYGTLKVEYSRAINHFEEDDQFIAQYAFDNGDFETLETLTHDQDHETVSFDIPNPDRDTRLTLHFYTTADDNQDMAAIDNVKAFGENAPIFYEGFENGDFALEGWTTVTNPTFIHDEENEGYMWTDDNDYASGHADGEHVTKGHGVALHGNNHIETPEAIEKTVDTRGFENIYLRYARRTVHFEEGDTMRAQYSTDDGTTWNDLEVITHDLAYNAVMFGPISDANNNVHFKIRFAVEANTTADKVYMDDVAVWGSVAAPEEHDTDDGGSEGDEPAGVVISGETVTDIATTGATVTWTTDRPATSRVVYDTTSHGSLGAEPNYEYASSTVEKNEGSDATTTHIVILTDLTPGVPYFFRVISHASPESVGDEKNFSTLSITHPEDSENHEGNNTGDNNNSNNTGTGNTDSNGSNNNESHADVSLPPGGNGDPSIGQTFVSGTVLGESITDQIEALQIQIAELQNKLIGVLRKRIHEILEARIALLQARLNTLLELEKQQ